MITFLLWPLVQFSKSVMKLYRYVLTIVLESVQVRVLLILVMAVTFALSLKSFPSTEFFPETKVESYGIILRPRAGQSLAVVDRASLVLEEQLKKVTTLDNYSISVSPREVRVIAGFDKLAVSKGEVEPVNELSPVLDSLSDQPVLLDTFLDHRLESMNPLQSLLGTNEGDILLKISGPDLEVIDNILRGSDGSNGILATLSKDRKKYGIAGLGKIAEGIPEQVLKIKRDAAADRGLTLTDIADQVEAAVAGTKVTDIEIRSANYDIMLSSANKVSSRKDLLAMDILSPTTGRIWKLSDVAVLESKIGPIEIAREERERVISIPIFIDQSTVPLGDAIARLDAADGPVRTAIAEHLEAGYNASLGGASEAMTQSLRYLLYAFLVAIVLVYMIMASQFESLIHPFTIMFSVPLSLIGGIIGLRLTGELISLTSVIGIIMLAGIVVNNAIILIDYINILRARGQPRNEAIVNAGVTRLRPILMTALTTVLGMIPLAMGLGTGAELYRPLAIVMVFGLSFSTLLTLIVIPAIYCLLDDLTDAFGLLSFRISNLFSKT